MSSEMLSLVNTINAMIYQLAVFAPEKSSRSLEKQMTGTLLRDLGFTRYITSVDVWWTGTNVREPRSPNVAQTCACLVVMGRSVDGRSQPLPLLFAWTAA